MDKSEIKHLIVESLNLQIPPDSIQNDTLLNTELGVDSVNALELATVLEEKYNVNIEDDMIYTVLKNVDTIYDFFHTEIQTEA